jgi:fatty acid-binding protein DegV
MGRWTSRLTSRRAPASGFEALSEAYRGGDGVCAVHVSGDLSATVARGREAAAMVGPDVNVIDTRSLSVGSGLVAAAVRRMAEDPDRSASILQIAQELPDRLHTFVLVQNAEPLRRSCRAGLLPEDHLKRGRPLLLSVRSRSVLLDQVRDRTRAVRELVAHARLSAAPDIGAWALGHGDASDWATVLDEASRVLGGRPAFTAPLDPTVGAHVGPDAIVIAVVSGPVEL